MKHFTQPIIFQTYWAKQNGQAHLVDANENRSLNFRECLISGFTFFKQKDELEKKG